MKSRIVPRITAKFLIPLIMLFGLYVQFHGDYGPGGGFQAGVIFAAAFVLYAVIWGVHDARKLAKPAVLRFFLGLGVLLYSGVGCISLFKGGQYLEYAKLFSPHEGVPLRLTEIHGQHIGILLVELGVGMTVASAMISIFFIFAKQERN